MTFARRSRHPLKHALIPILVGMLLCAWTATAHAALPTTDGPWPGFGDAQSRAAQPATPISDIAQQAEAAYQSGDRIISVVIAQDLDDDSIILSRHLPDGSLDPSFGVDGYLMHPVPVDAGRVVQTVDVIVDAQDRIVLVGAYPTAVEQVGFVARLLPDGSLDPSFAGDGIFEQPLCSGSDRMARIVPRAGGGYIVASAGDANCVVPTPLMNWSTRARTQVYAIDANGVPIAGFAAPVTISVDDGDWDQHVVVGMVAQPDGGVVVTEWSQNAVTYMYNRTTITRIDGTGSLVPSFGTGGRVVITDAQAVGAVPGTDPGDFRLVTVRDNRGFVLEQYHGSDGSLDAAWATANGVVDSDPTTAVWAATPNGSRVVQDPLGGIVMCGIMINAPDWASLAGHYEQTVVRWSPTGQIRERVGEFLDHLAPGTISIYTGCAAGSDGRLARFGTAQDPAIPSAYPILEQRYGRYDFTPPVVGSITETPGGATTSYTFSASDPSSGLEDVDGAYSFDGGATWQAAPSATLPTLVAGDADRTLRVRDRAGNVSSRTFAAPTAPAVPGGGGGGGAPAPGGGADTGGPSPAAPTPAAPAAPSFAVSSSATYRSVTFRVQVVDPVGDRGPYRFSFDGGATWQAASSQTYAGLAQATVQTASVTVRASDGTQASPVDVSETTRSNGAPALSVGIKPPRGPREEGGAALKPVPAVIRDGFIQVAGSSAYGEVQVTATFLGRPVPVRDGRIAVTAMREGAGTLSVRATDIDGDVTSTKRNVRVDRSAPWLTAANGRYIIGPTVVLKARDTGSGVKVPRVRVKLEARTGSMTVSAKVRDKAGNAGTRKVTVERRIALRDQGLNRDLRLTSRDGSKYAPVKGGSHGAFRFLDYIQPYYSQLEYQDPYVKEAQWRLAMMGCLKPASFQPGRLDMPTIRAVQAYQRIKGFEVLGTVGPRTRHALDLDLMAGLPRACR